MRKRVTQDAIYIPLPQDDMSLKGQAKYSEYLLWLINNAGKMNKAWWWRYGDLVAQGVYIVDPEIAVLFKLRFEV